MARAAHSATSRTIGPLLRLGVSDNGIREASRRLRYHTRSGLSNPGRSTEPISRRFPDPVRVNRTVDLLPGRSLLTGDNGVRMAKVDGLRHPVVTVRAFCPQGRHAILFARGACQEAGRQVADGQTEFG